ncbi:MAG TPA: hypothetical protein VFD73_09560, partial [Gemmatimonadales bacterium]|nr:hypothetical protein [Gemmatimonadales bacterium]
LTEAAFWLHTAALEMEEFTSALTEAAFKPPGTVSRSAGTAFAWDGAAPEVEDLVPRRPEPRRKVPGPRWRRPDPCAKRPVPPVAGRIRVQFGGSHIVSVRNRSPTDRLRI